MKKLMDKLGFDQKTLVRFFLIVSNSQLIYSFNNLRSVLYEPFTEALGVTNTQFGVLLGFIGFITVFGGAAVGWLQDRFAIRKVLAVNSFMYGGWALVMALWPGCPYALKCLFYISFGFNGDAMYWATVLKSVRTMAREDKQASAFGMMESGRAALDLLVGGGAVALYTVLGSNLFGMHTVMTVTAVITIVSGLSIWFFVPELKPSKEDAEQAKKNSKTQSAFAGFIKALKMPAVWMTGIAAACVYATFCAVYTYFVPYMQSVYLLPVALVGVFGVVNGSVTRIIAGPVAGFVSDWKFRSSAHMMRACYIVLTVLLSVVLLLPKNQSLILPAMVCLLVISIFCGMVRSVYYAPIGEMGVPEEMSAAAMAVAACIGYSPSFWAYPLYGMMIDVFQPHTAYNMIFVLLIMMSLAGVLLNTLLGRRILEHRAEKEKLEKEVGTAAL